MNFYLFCHYFSFSSNSFQLFRRTAPFTGSKLKAWGLCLTADSITTGPPTTARIFTPFFARVSKTVPPSQGRRGASAYSFCCSQ